MAPQNNTKTRPRPGGFQPGVSGNPGGRPKGLAAKVKEACGADGDKLVEAWAAIAFGTAKERKAIFGAALRIGVNQRLMALEQLADRGFGKPVQSVAMDDDTVSAVKVMFGGRFRPPAGA